MHRCLSVTKDNRTLLLAKHAINLSLDTESEFCSFFTPFKKKNIYTSYANNSRKLQHNPYILP